MDGIMRLLHVLSNRVVPALSRLRPLPQPTVFLFGEVVQQRLKSIGQHFFNVKGLKPKQMPPHCLARKLTA
ncbi:hypothetical protein DPM33_00370 [Mesorhizobium hawassense]|uniref:Uncharacterized protein n=1 Tax=Mesorhizobium hawassense TaxID=1209954 RepID=A0A330HVS3_9HYPH|nr:hypothetical protein DPM33_00370 [Mesorhizobium hawassense]